MVIDDQDLPVATVLSKAPNHTLAPVSNTDPATGPAKRIRPCVNRVGQDMMDGVVNRQFPNEAAPIIDCIVHRRQQNTFLPYPEMNLSNTLEFRKLPEYEPDRFANPGIGINIDSIVPDLYIADRHRQEELATTSLLFERLQGALPKDRELQFAHRALHAQQQPIVWVAWIVNTVLIHNDRTDQAAELDEGVPVTPVTRQSRHLDGKD